MKFKNISSFGDIEVTILGRTVSAGEIVSVTDDIAALFSAQPDVWQPVKKGTPE